jgi:hypothetical protein
MAQGEAWTVELLRMISNLGRYKKDLDALIERGELLGYAMQAAFNGKQFEAQLRTQVGEKTNEFLKKLPHFKSEYQSWYTEPLVLIKQLLPDRYADFVRHYEKPKSRKNIDYENYSIEDALHGLTVTRPLPTWEGGGEKTIVAPHAAIPHFDQQKAILKSVKARFESSLFDIQQLLQADLFDSELDAARELAKHKFLRAAGAVAGVVLEKHLGQVCSNHNIKVTKKDPTISDLNDLLKGAGVIQLPEWRSIQHLADIRNLCDHDKKVEPTPEQVKDLLEGTAKVTKTLF